MSISLQIEEFKKKVQLRFREESSFPNRPGHVSVKPIFLIITYIISFKKYFKQQSGLGFDRKLNIVVCF